MYETAEYDIAAESSAYEGDFRMMLDDAKNWAERSGLREEDIDSVIKSVRRQKRA